MMSLRKCALGIVVALAGAGALVALASNEADHNNSQEVSAPAHGGSVSVNANVGGHAVTATIPVEAGWSARRKALEIANAINLDSSNTAGGPRCVAKVGSDGSTVTVTSNPGFGPVTNFAFDANKTGEEDKNKGKTPQTIGTAKFEFSGLTGMPGIVKVGIGEIEWVFDVANYTTLADLRNDVASTLTTNGYTAYVGVDGAIYATVPGDVDGVMMCVDCETLNADYEGYVDSEE